jgi:tRNA modification GTPase trmE
LKLNDTVAAIATAAGEGGIGVIRVSGDEAVAITDKIYRGRKKLSTLESHTINYGHIINVDSDDYVDEVLISIMKAPKSYTGEDCVEINCHGGSLVLQSVLMELIKAGANLAQPGEFTKRAFLNGKIDLSAAESVSDIIEAKNSYALKSALAQLNGKLKDKILSLRKIILEEAAFIEAAADDPEHYEFENSDLYNKILAVDKDIERLLESSENGRIIKEGINTVILGRPNVGKSSILNLLTGKEAAIVSDIPGTTRDMISEHIKMAGINLKITDTAGIRKSSDMLENIGIERARDAAKEADLIICVIDSSENLNNDDIELIQDIKNSNIKSLILLNKSDKKNVIAKEDIKEITDIDVVLFSAREAYGLEELESIIKQKFYNKEISFDEEIFITNIRHKEALLNAKSSIQSIIEGIKNRIPEDFFSIDLMEAYESLGSIIGESVSEDLIDEIFSKFCMGK